MNTKVTSATKTSSGIQLTMEDAKGGNEQKVERGFSCSKNQIEADVVLVAIGRRPYLDGLGLKEMGITVNKRGVIEVDKQFRTSIPSIRAIGDAIPGPMLAHKAEEEGIAAIEDIASPGAGHVNYGAIPSVIYTWPEVAWVGRTEEELKADQVQYVKGRFPFMANSRARTNG